MWVNNVLIVFVLEKHVYFIYFSYNTWSATWLEYILLFTDLFFQQVSHENSKNMVASGIIAAAFGTGTALLIAMTIVVYRYYNFKRKTEEWGSLEQLTRKRSVNVTKYNRKQSYPLPITVRCSKQKIVYLHIHIISISLI